MWEHFIDIEDLTLNSPHTTLVFQAEDKGVACPPLSLGRTDVCTVAIYYMCVLQMYIYCGCCLTQHDLNDIMTCSTVIPLSSFSLIFHKDVSYFFFFSEGLKWAIFLVITYYLLTNKNIKRKNKKIIRQKIIVIFEHNSSSFKTN